MHTRPATPAEILAYCEGRRQSFERGCMETADHRTENGIRHIRRNRATVRNVDGVPTVTCNGQDCRLYGVIIIYDDGSESRIPALLSILQTHRNGGR